MELRKMRHQRGRVRPTVRPADLAAHPEGLWNWRQEVVVDGPRAHAVCAHCHRAMPCPTQAYLHGRDGHAGGFCGGPGACHVLDAARYAREHERV